jgi:hypothetical protein
MRPPIVFQLHLALAAARAELDRRQREFPPSGVKGAVTRPTNRVSASLARLGTAVPAHLHTFLEGVRARKARGSVVELWYVWHPLALLFEEMGFNVSSASGARIPAVMRG